MHEDASHLFHVFGEGYFICDETGQEVSNFAEEAKLNSLIKVFRRCEFTSG